jgi:hypothetical protein
MTALRIMLLAFPVPVGQSGLDDLDASFRASFAARRTSLVGVGADDGAAGTGELGAGADGRAASTMRMFSSLIR